MADELKEVLKIASQWRDLARANATPPDDEQLFRFVALWIAFNALYALTFPKPRSERGQLEELAKWHLAQKAHVDALEAANNGYKLAVETLKRRGVYNFLIKDKEYINSSADLQQVINSVYLVRCNLFHGRKVPDNLLDRELIAAAHVIVEKLLDALLIRSVLEEHIRST